MCFSESPNFKQNASGLKKNGKRWKKSPRIKSLLFEARGLRSSVQKYVFVKTLILLDITIFNWPIILVCPSRLPHNTMDYFMIEKRPYVS